MRPCYQYAVFKPAEFGKHFSTGNDRNVSLFCLYHLRVDRRDSRRYYHYMSMVYIFTGVSYIYLYPKVFQSVSCLGFPEIRACHLVAKIVQHLGNAAHTNAADADKMNDPVLIKHMIPPIKQAIGKRLRAKG